MTRAWHEFPEPRPGSGAAMAAAVVLGLVFAFGTFLYGIAWELASVIPPEAAPAAALTAARWVVWSACLLLILAAVVLAQRARGGASTVRHAWFAVAGAAAAGLLFSALARFGPIGAPA